MFFMNCRARKLSQTVSVLAAILLVAGILSCNQNKRYPLQAQVTAKDLSMREITLIHGDIPGFMPAMTMPYRLNNVQALQDLEPGDKITAEVVVANRGRDYWLEHVRITDRSGRGQVKQEVSPSRMLMPGEPAPDVPLVNQDGRTIHLSDFKGKALLVTFIYTRCPMPDFCPRLTSEFARVHNEFKKSGDDYSHTHLLTISFDPKYDAPPVLRKYGLAYLDGDKTGFSHWDFATGDPKDLKALAHAFGLSYEEQGGLITHTMSIALIAPDGTIVKFWGANWTWMELADSMRRAVHSSSEQSEVHEGGSTP
jgi:protein SCO1